jgi:hypothetical protein
MEHIAVTASVMSISLFKHIITRKWAIVYFSIRMAAVYFSIRMAAVYFIIRTTSRSLS